MTTKTMTVLTVTFIITQQGLCLDLGPLTPIMTLQPLQHSPPCGLLHASVQPVTMTANIDLAGMDIHHKSSSLLFIHKFKLTNQWKVLCEVFVGSPIRDSRDKMLGCGAISVDTDDCVDVKRNMQFYVKYCSSGHFKARLVQMPRRALSGSEIRVGWRPYYDDPMLNHTSRDVRRFPPVYEHVYSDFRYGDLPGDVHVFPHPPRADRVPLRLTDHVASRTLTFCVQKLHEPFTLEIRDLNAEKSESQIRTFETNETNGTKGIDRTKRETAKNSECISYERDFTSVTGNKKISFELQFIEMAACNRTFTYSVEILPAPGRAEGKTSVIWSVMYAGVVLFLLGD